HDPLTSLSCQPTTFDNTITSCDPSYCNSKATYSNVTPTARSPAAASMHGMLPDFVYSAMFLTSASRYFQPSASFIRWRIDATDRYPVPEEAGFGMTISPL